MMQASLTVIIPTRGRHSLIGATVQRLLQAQSITVIVVDDGSEPPIQSQDSYGRSVRVIRIDKSGRSAARNTGLEAAQTKYVAFLDSDDVPNPRAYQAATSLLEMSEAAMVRCRSVDFADGSSPYFAEEKLAWRSISSRTAISLRWGGVLCNVYRRDFLLDQGIRFPVGVDLGEDLVVSLALAVASSTILDCNLQLFAYRRGREDQSTSANSSLWRELPRAAEACEGLLAQRQSCVDDRGLLFALVRAYGIRGFPQVEPIQRRALKGAWTHYESGIRHRLRLRRRDAFLAVARLLTVRYASHLLGWFLQAAAPNHAWRTQ